MWPDYLLLESGLDEELGRDLSFRRRGMWGRLVMAAAVVVEAVGVMVVVVLVAAVAVVAVRWHIWGATGGGKKQESETAIVLQGILFPLIRVCGPCPIPVRNRI